MSERERIDEIVAAVREGLEVVTVELASSTPGRGAIDDLLLQATSSLGAFLDRREVEDEALADLERGRVALAAAAGHAQGPAAREVADALALLGDARAGFVELLATQPFRSVPPAAADLRASLGHPALHAFAVPSPRLLQLETRDDDEDDDDDAPAVATPVTALGPDLAMARAMARECLEDIASFGSLRRLWDAEPWSDAAPFEERLLRSLDALASLDRPLDPATPRAEVVEEAWRFATEWSVPDLGRAFALAFVLACSDAGSALRWIALGLRRTDPRVHASFVDALVLGSHVGIDALVGELCRDDDPALATVGFKVAARRGTVDPVATVLAFGLREEVARAALDAAVGLPAEFAPPLVDVVARGDSALAAAAASALVTMGAQAGPLHARRMLDDAIRASDSEGSRGVAWTTAAALAALGDPRDVERLQAASAMTPTLAPWLAVHGFAAHLPTLASLLAASQDRREHDVARSLARALELLSGEPVTAAGEDEEGEPCAFDVTTYLASEPVRRLGGGRLLAGRAWSVAAVCDELARPAAAHADRRRLAQALATATHGVVRIDCEGWVSRQRLDLEHARRSAR